MTFSYPDAQIPVVFSANSSAIRVNSSRSAEVKISVSFNGGYYGLVTLTDKSGTVLIDLKAILQGVAQISPFQYLLLNHLEAYQFTPNVTLRGDFSDGSSPESLDIRCLPGGIIADGSIPVPLNKPLTHRPIISTTHSDGLEVLPFILSERPSYGFVKARVRESSGKVTSIILPVSFPNGGDHPYLLLLDCSLNRILHEMHYAIVASDVISYDIEFNGEIRHRFFVSKESAQCFIFRNTMGAYDTIYATGVTGRTLDKEFSFSKKEHTDIPIPSEALDKISINSGCLVSDEEINQWHDFLVSNEQYIYEGGNLYQIIIDDADAETKKGALSTIAFTYHKAERLLVRAYKDDIIK